MTPAGTSTNLTSRINGMTTHNTYTHLLGRSGCNPHSRSQPGRFHASQVIAAAPSHPDLRGGHRFLPLGKGGLLGGVMRPGLLWRHLRLLRSGLRADGSCSDRSCACGGAAPCVGSERCEGCYCTIMEIREESGAATAGCRMKYCSISLRRKVTPLNERLAVNTDPDLKSDFHDSTHLAPHKKLLYYSALRSFVHSFIRSSLCTLLISPRQPHVVS